MNNNKLKWFSSLLIVGVAALTFTLEDNNVQAIDINSQYGCNPDVNKMKEYDTDAEFYAYLDKIGVKKSLYISRAGKTLTVDPDVARDRCLIVYGKPADVVSEGKKVQTYSNGYWKYQGYSANGTLYPTPEYPDYSNNPSYMKVMDFIKSPWSHTALNQSIAVSPIKPYTSPPSEWPSPFYPDPKNGGRVHTIEEELDRTIDRMYVTYCGTSCGLGLRGHFNSVNDYEGVKMVGSNLKNYISVEEFAGEYSPGAWHIYRTEPGVGYFFSTNWMPPYKQFGQEQRDLSIKINSITPSSLIEGYSYTVNYTVCNKGEIRVDNPVIHYGEGTASKSKTLNVSLDDEECYTGNIGETAGSVSADTTKTYKMEVNKARNNPTFENPTTNNYSTKDFTVINKVIDGKIEITSWTRTYPNSNENITINYKITNKSNVPVYNVKYKIGYSGAQVDKTISSMTAGESKSLSVTVKTPVVKAYTGDKVIKGQITAGFSGDVNTSDNTVSKTVTVRNPDAFVDIIVNNDSSDNTIGDAKIKVTNRTWKTIKQDCSLTSDCKTGTTKKEYVIKVYDTKFTTSPADDVLVATYKPTYSLTYGNSEPFTINRSIFKNWIDTKYPDTYQLVQFRIDAQIPEYAEEVNWDGDDYYSNNSDSEILNYFPERPDIAATQCNEVEHSSSSYFNTSNGGFNPIKICAGHYPTYPSTQVESGMQAYHYVLYRFFPQPMPKYEVTTPETDVSNPNHFSQIFELPDSEDYRQMGDFESMFFPNNTSNGYYQERGRYMPTGGTFNFEVYKKNSNGTKGQQIALGTVSYNIPSGCYDRYNLDINHHYSCDEIMFFLPNPDVDPTKHKKPANYTGSNVTFPISGTRIPYLNPGEYTFEFKATESFRYYYQTNMINNGYLWEEPKFR